MNMKPVIVGLAGLSLLLASPIFGGVADTVAKVEHEGWKLSDRLEATDPIA